MAYLGATMEFVETPTFTKLVLELMSDDDYAKLQAILAVRPESGAIIPGAGGIRKLRWSFAGRGKRGGLRVIYYWYASSHQIWMLTAYRKGKKDDLSADEVKALKKLVKESLK